MDIALILLIVIGASLGYGLHGILLLRWCGRWTRNRRLLLWVSQMLFPYVTGPALGWVGGTATALVVGEQPGMGWRATWVSALAWATWLLPALLLITAGFVVGPALAMLRRPLVWGSAFVGAPAGWGATIAAGSLTGDPDASVWIGVLGWHAGALGAPLAFAWRVRMKRKRALGGRACLDCGYDLTGVTLDRCPECGAKRPAAT